MSPFRHSRRRTGPPREVVHHTGATADPTVIDVDLEGQRARAAEVIAAHGRGHTPFGTYVFAASDPASELARHVERTVFADSFGQSREAIDREHAPYDPTSLFLCVVDHRRALPVGAVRLILAGPAGFKSLNDIERDWGQRVDDVVARTWPTLDPARTWDIATLGVDPAYRRGMVSQALHQAICTGALHAGVDRAITILDIVVLRLLQLQTHRVFSPYPGVGSAPYEGSISIPMWSDLVAYRHRLRDSHPELCETLFEGRHLEPVLSTPDWDEVARLASAVVTDAAAGGPWGRPPQTMSRTVAA